MYNLGRQPLDVGGLSSWLSMEDARRGAFHRAGDQMRSRSRRNQCAVFCPTAFRGLYAVADAGGRCQLRTAARCITAQSASPRQTTGNHPTSDGHRGARQPGMLPKPYHRGLAMTLLIRNRSAFYAAGFVVGLMGGMGCSYRKLRPGHNGDVARRGPAVEECGQSYAQRELLVRLCRATDAS